MIVQFFNHGTGKASSAINYLLQEKDSDGKIRDPEPEVFSGDPDLTSFLIDTNKRKFKYSSGVISFRDGEKPTEGQLNKIMKSFREKFCPDLGPEKVNMLVVKHQDKGNLELHIIVPMVEMTTMKQFNIHPPGKYTQQLSKDFQALWNHKLEFAQVVEDPLKAQFHNFDMKVEKTGQTKFSKDSFSRIITKKIRAGQINNRDELCDYLTGKGFLITRRGIDYISVKGPNQKKAIRMIGPMFEKNANFKELIKYADIALNNSQLNPFELSSVINRLNTAVSYRKTFNNKTYVNKPKRIYKSVNKKPAISKSKPVQAVNIQINSNTKPQEIKSESLSAKSKNQSSGKNIKPKSNKSGSQSATSPPSGKVNSVNRTHGVINSLGSLQIQIDAAQADLANSTSLEGRINAESRLRDLMFQRNKLLEDLELAKLAELNSNNLDKTKTPRPKKR